MKKCKNLIWLQFAGMVLISLLTIVPKFCLAAQIPDKIPGNFEGKWYGMFSPAITKENCFGIRHGEAFPNQTILSSWGYKAKPIEEIKDLVPGDIL